MTIGERIAQFATDWIGHEVIAVESRGTDWNGDTESGFWSTFELDFITAAGRDSLEGERLRDFWLYVMNQPLE